MANQGLVHRDATSNSVIELDVGNDSFEDAAAVEGRGDNNKSDNDWMSEEEKNEAYDAGRKTQLKLDPLQVCLFPTYLSLPQKELQEDLRDNLQALVNSKLREDYGDDFVYFAFTDAKIDWYSGEESQPVCGKVQDRLPGEEEDAVLRNIFLQRDSTPCTCALYLGATVMLKTNRSFKNGQNLATQGILEPKISAVLTDQLVATLHDSLISEEANQDILQRPFYTEVKGASVSWSVAERQQGGKLVYVSSAEDVQLLDAETPLPEPVIAIVDEAVKDSTTIDVVKINGLEGSDLQSSAANGFSTTKGKVLGSVLGALLLVILGIVFCRLRFKKKQKQRVMDGATIPAGKANDELGDQDEVDEEIARGGRRKSWLAAYSDGGNSNDNEDDDQESEAAQYKTHRKANSNGSILDCVSVGSEWTLTTGVTDGVSSALGIGSTGNKTMAEMLAAKETFDRDRKITLQKDMLQSEWTGAVPPPSGLALSRSGSRSRSKQHFQIENNNDPNALQFEEAMGQGEELFLMEPAR